ncbi:MAG TPA: hypothetical protein VJR23_09975 [Candidatus Acidoferrales bacterium]|nr:hypothetical protein [Candidatus Acidoferrales bacterium]
MVMCQGRNLQIEDLRNHPTETILSLREVLESGAEVTPDPKRAGFFEVEDGARVYYINIARPTGKILLLATWPSLHAKEERALAECCAVS